MTNMTYAAFALVAFITVATPGPTVLLAMSNGAKFGLRRAITGIIGAALSDVVLIIAVAIGLGAVLAASEFWFAVVKWVGVAYLAYLGFGLLRASGTATDVNSSSAEILEESTFSTFVKSFLVAVTNPKGYLFFSALLPQFIDTAQPATPQYVVLAIIFVTIDFVAMTAYAVVGLRAAKVMSSTGTQRLTHICGGVLLTMAGVLAFYRRSNA
jgi:threonine/homoserine/homoserine lactone efflux protein